MQRGLAPVQGHRFLDAQGRPIGADIEFHGNARRRIQLDLHVPGHHGNRWDTACAVFLDNGRGYQEYVRRCILI